MDKRVTGIVICAISALLLIFSIATNKWFVGESYGTKAGIGVWGNAEVCQGDRCETVNLEELMPDKRGRDTAFFLFGKLTFFTGILTILGLAGVAALGGARHEKTPMVGRLTQIATVVTILCGMVFMINKPEMPGINASWGVFTFMIGGMAGIIGATILGKPDTLHAADPDVPRL